MIVRNVRLLLLTVALIFAATGLVGCDQTSNSSAPQTTQMAKKAPHSNRAYESNWDEEETQDIDSGESQSQPPDNDQNQRQAQEQQQVQGQEQIQEQGDSSIARVSVRAPADEPDEELARRRDRPRVKTVEVERSKPASTIEEQAGQGTTAYDSAHDSADEERSSHDAPATNEVPPQESEANRPSERSSTGRIQINPSSGDGSEIEDRDIDVQSGETRAYAGVFQPLNAVFFRQPIAGSVRIETQMGEVRIDLNVTGLEDGSRHLIQMYSNSVCPPIGRTDFNSDGVIDIMETTSVVGKILFPFDTPLANIAINRDIGTGLMTDEDGEVAFEASARLSEIENALRQEPIAANIPVARLGPNERLDFENRVIIVHGIPRAQALPISVQSFGTLPATMTVPIACAEIDVVQVESTDPQANETQNDVSRDEESSQSDAAVIDLHVNPNSNASSIPEADTDLDSEVVAADDSGSDVIR